jgi:putative ABC transport system permease protein
MALGAEAGAVVRLILGDSAKLLLGGIAAGLALAVLATRYAATLLFGVSPVDPASFALASAVLAAGSLIACYVPARQATHIDPATTLRDV